MPSHYDEPKVEVEMEKPKRKSGMRKMSDKEKGLMKKHLEMHMAGSSKSDKARARMAVMRSEKEVKSMKSLHSLLGK